MKRQVVVQALKTASAQITHFQSESQMLKQKIAELNKKVTDLDKEAKAGKLAMRLSLDEETIKELSEKTASLKGEDLAVVEKAIQLDLAKKVASIGKVDEEDANTNLDASAKFRQMLLSLKN